MDGRGVPLSIIVTAANVNDGKRLDAVLSAIVVKRKRPPVRRSKHLCADAGYRSAENLRVIDQHGYIAHVVDRRKEIDIKRRDPTKKARRWVVEVCHSWFNRFRKLLVRYEKLERSFVALRGRDDRRYRRRHQRPADQDRFAVALGPDRQVQPGAADRGRPRRDRELPRPRGVLQRALTRCGSSPSSLPCCCW